MTAARRRLLFANGVFLAAAVHTLLATAVHLVLVVGHIGAFVVSRARESA